MPRIKHRLVDFELDAPTVEVFLMLAQSARMRPWRFAQVLVAELVERHLPCDHGGFPERPL